MNIYILRLKSQRAETVVAHRPTTPSPHRTKETEPEDQIIEAVHSRDDVPSIERDLDVMDRACTSTESDNDLEQEDDPENGDYIPYGSENEPGSETDERNVEVDMELSEEA